MNRLGGCSLAPDNKGENMPQTKMKAKRMSCCPLCFIMIPKGSDIKVYNNSWYHIKCADAVTEAADAKKKLQMNLFN